MACSLQVCKKISAYPFVNQSFPIQLYLTDSKNQLLLGHGDLDVDPHLSFQNSEVELNVEDYCIIEPARPSINNLGVADMRVTFTQLSMNHNNRKFVLKFTVRDSSSLPAATTMSTASAALDSSHSSALVSANGISLSTDSFNAKGIGSSHGGNDEMATGNDHLTAVVPPLLVVRQRLVMDIHVHDALVSDADDTVTLLPPASVSEGGPSSDAIPSRTHIWYKDEGGRDHGVSVMVSLIDREEENGHIVPVKQVSLPFVLSLCYSDNGEAVQGRPGLLSVLPEGVPCIIDRLTGQSPRKVRINDISKNHQRRSFVIKVQPDLSKNPLLLDVAGAESDAIEVRSKRTKRQRDLLLGINPLPGALCAEYPSHNGLISPTTRAEVAIDDTSHALDKKQFSKVKTLDNSRTKKLKIAESSASSVLSGGADPPKNHLTTNISPESDAVRTTSFDVENAVRNTLQWTERILQALMHDLRWRHIGFSSMAQSPNIPDTNSPLFSMSNPNALLDKLQEEYMTNVYDALNVIVKCALREKPSMLDRPNSSSTRLSAVDLKQSTVGYPQQAAASSSSATFLGRQPADAFQTLGLQHISNLPLTPAGRARSHSLSLELPHAMGGSASGAAMRAPSLMHTHHSLTTVPLTMTPSDNQDETSVYYIVAVPYDLQSNCRASSQMSSQLYFPAYDVHKELVGFYTERKDDRNATVITFYSIHSSLCALVDKVVANRFLHSYLFSDSHSVSSDCSDEVYSLPKVHFDLQALKQEAMVHYWLMEVGLEAF